LFRFSYNQNFLSLHIAITRLLRNSGNENFKMVYMAPTKALCSERVRDWSSKFRSLGIVCCGLTSDTEYIALDELRKGNVM